MIEVGKTEEYYVTIGETKHTLTPEEAEKLYDQLHTILGKKVITITPSDWVPKEPLKRNPLRPYRQPWEDVQPIWPAIPPNDWDGRPYVTD